MGLPAKNRPSQAWRTPSSAAAAAAMSCSELKAALLEATGVRPVVHTSMEKASNAAGSGYGGADNDNVIKVCDDLSCRLCGGHALEGSLERKGEQEGGEWAPLLHAAGGEDRRGFVWSASEESTQRAALRPGENIYSICFSPIFCKRENLFSLACRSFGLKAKPIRTCVRVKIRGMPDFLGIPRRRHGINLLDTSIILHCAQLVLHATQLSVATARLNHN
jgi:hypothetical protein